MRDSYHIGFSIAYYIDKKRVEFQNIIVKILIPWRKIKLGKPDDGTIEDLSDIIEFHCDEPESRFLSFRHQRAQCIVVIS